MEPEVRGVAAAEGRTAVLSDAVPTPAAKNPVRAATGTGRIGHRTGRIIAFPILHPFIHIPVHIIQAVSIIVFIISSLSCRNSIIYSKTYQSSVFNNFSMNVSFKTAGAF